LIKLAFTSTKVRNSWTWKYC